MDFLACLFATILHEYAHYFSASKLGMEIHSAQITPFGGMIEIPLAKYPWQSVLIVISAGGIFNLAIAVLLCAVWWFFPVSYGVTYLFARANITIALVNFLPCYPLDGGRGAYLWCKDVLKIKNAERVISIFGIVLGSLFVGVFVIFCQNITLLLLGIFMVIGSEKTLKNMSQISAIEKWNYKNISDEKRLVLQENVLVVSGSLQVYRVFFHFKRNGENILKIRLDKSREIIVSQAKLYDKIISNSEKISTQTTLFELFS